MYLLFSQPLSEIPLEALGTQGSMLVLKEGKRERERERERDRTQVFFFYSQSALITSTMEVSWNFWSWVSASPLTLHVSVLLPPTTTHTQYGCSPSEEFGFLVWRVLLYLLLSMVSKVDLHKHRWFLRMETTI